LVVRVMIVLAAIVVGWAALAAALSLAALGMGGNPWFARYIP